MKSGAVAILAGCMIALAGCKPTESTTSTPPSPPAKEALYQEGHHLYMTGNLDSAVALLQGALALDSAYVEPLQDLGALHFDRGMREQGATVRSRSLSRARTYFARLDKLGAADAEVYDRLCQIAVELNDGKSFIAYARKSVEKYPYDRQYYNLGIAYFNAGDYSAVVKSQKDAAARFPQSSYLSSFYRQAGRAYQKMDRDQRAIEMFEAGLAASESGLAALRKKGKGYASTPEYQRIADDRTTMLVLLRKLYYTYRQPEKLKKVEQELRDAGVLK